MADTPHNRLGAATSPYLLQHAGNPVHWWEWGREAFAEAVRLDRPVLLSVGYAACHWCHVMAHESFEDPSTAEVMNRLFTNIKVDREERPDVDRIYMDAVQAATGRGGWPMTAFLTPEGKPFYTGTYFPKNDRGGLPGFVRVMEAISEAWQTRRDEITEQAGRLTAAVRTVLPAAEEAPGLDALRAAYAHLETIYDPQYGGFGGAPKFPQAPTLEFLLRIADEEWAPRASSMLEHTLTSMAAGGIYDHLGGGFSRYSVDQRWLIPHFEKMLYDNALLARLYLRASQVTGNDDFLRVARETLDYMLTDLLLPEGGFSAAEDADSEGEEGRFYAFALDELQQAAGEHADVAARYFGVTAEGNFEGSNVLHRSAAPAAIADALDAPVSRILSSIEEARQLLLTFRAGRTRPSLDDKAVLSWNAMAIRSLAEAGVVMAEKRYLTAAVGAAGFILEHLRDRDGRLYRSWRDGRVSGPAYADDYASMAVALFTLYQATGDEAWYREAVATTEAMIDLFWDVDDGGVFATGHDAERLIARPKNLYDNPTPSDNSMAAEALTMLAAATGEPGHIDKVLAIARVAGALIERSPSAVGHLLAILALLDEQRELAIVGDPDDDRTLALLQVANGRFRPGVFLALGNPADDTVVPLLNDRTTGPDGAPQAYLCAGFVCAAPTSDPEAFRSQLG